jgi:hypothetical protein
VETTPPKLLSDESLGSVNDSDSYAFGREDADRGPMPKGSSDELALEEGDVIYIYPMEVTEYYLLIPRDSDEMAG